MELQRSAIVIRAILTVIISANNVNTLAPSRPNQLVAYSLPEARELKMALGYDEDTYLNFTELTSKYGYRTEVHSVTTEDDYILSAFRILSKCNETSRKLYPILLVHGIVDTSDVWILPGEDFGLGYVLARNCFDVWAANLRGNRYSRKHVNLDPDRDTQYWEFSFDEHGNYDLPALIDYVLRVTGKPRLFYAGHSQGTTNFFAMGSLRPEYNEKVQLSIQLAPVAWMTHAYSPLPRLLAPNVREIREFLDAAGFKELLANNRLIHFVVEVLCNLAPEATCGNALYFSTGYEQGSIARNVLGIVFGHILSGTSTKSLEHYSQLFVSSKFKRFDEGYRGNIKRYGQRKPPEYDVSRITSPVVLMSARNDWLSSLKDVKKLSSKLTNLVESYVVPVLKWSHHNYHWDERSKIYVIPKILKYLEQYNV